MKISYPLGLNVWMSQFQWALIHAAVTTFTYFSGPTDNNIITLLLFTANAKSVSYLIAADGNPWVWVLGEGDDKPDSFEIFRSKWTGSLVNDL